MLGDYELLGLMLKGDKKGIKAVLKRREKESLAHAEELAKCLEENKK